MIPHELLEMAPQIRDGESFIITGNAALSGAGMSNWFFTSLDILTQHEELHQTYVRSISYVYSPLTWNDYKYTEQLTEHIFTPTRERAIVECILHEMASTDEGNFCECYYNYLHTNWENIPLLTEVANYFGVTQEQLDYWEKESIDYMVY